MARKLPLKFYARDAAVVAPELLGMLLVHHVGGQARVGRIVETEAYQGPEDQAAHSAGGRRTPRNEIMYGPAGHSYVYFVYGLFHCVNVITQRVGIPHGVLIRALEPVSNLEGKTSGPGLLCRAMGIDRSHNGLNLRGDQLYIAHPGRKHYRTPEVHSTPRIGVDYAGTWVSMPWRFFDTASSCVSKAPKR
ncbi:MAG TPA: DNA-3-methyladenine glycosylase [Polyangiaceae bacterium]|nr:DNA-3-methyladenine glycosylase [Polyangiaceae bacterium]